jgi:small subunit ribosomal protein S4
MRYLGSKNKLARHHGKDVFGTQSASLEKRLNQKPGQHGNTLKKPSTYGKQLIEKQYVKRVYGVSEKQFRITTNKQRKLYFAF